MLHVKKQLRNKGRLVVTSMLLILGTPMRGMEPLNERPQGDVSQDEADLLLDALGELRSRVGECGRSVQTYLLPEEIRQWCARGGNPNDRDSSGRTALHLAAFLRNSDEVIRTWIAQGADVNICDDSGLTPLWYAQKSSTAKILLDHGASPQLTDLQGNTLLHHSADKQLFDDERVEKIKLVLAAGINVHKKNMWGISPLASYASIVEDWRTIGTIRETDLNKDEKEYFTTCYHIMRELIQHGANPYERKKFGNEYFSGLLRRELPVSPQVPSPIKEIIELFNRDLKPSEFYNRDLLLYDAEAW